MTSNDNKPAFVKRDSIVSGTEYANIRYTKRWYEFYNQDNTILHQLGEEFRMPNLQQPGDDFKGINASDREGTERYYRHLSVR